MSQGIFRLFMDFTTRLLKSTATTMSGTTLQMLLTIFLLQLSYKDRFFAFMEDYHPKERQSTQSELWNGMFRSQLRVRYAI